MTDKTKVYGAADGGGNAFPNNSFANGLTKRDYFAAKAMQGLIVHVQLPSEVNEAVAKEAYALADAMLAQRKGGTE